MRITGAKAIVECLRAEGVDVIFGYPGGAVISIYDALYDSGIKHILTRHEQGAVHAADGYARVSGRPGVVIATSGPGATNLVTGLANAYMDSVPLVAFTGQVGTAFIGRDSFQEADITGITMPITKHNYLVSKVTDIPRVVKEAFHIASTGRPGPVLIDLPKDVTAAELDFSYPEEVNLPGYKPTYKGHPRQIREAANAINQASRPVLVAGGGVVAANASSQLRQLAEKANLPVTATLMGLSAFPGNHELFLGMPGMHGTAYANYALTECDLLIAVGMRFDDRVTGKLDEFAPNAKVIHIDIDPAEIGKNVRVDIPIVGDARLVLEELCAFVEAKARHEWLGQIEEWKKEYLLSYGEDHGTEDAIMPQYIVEQICEATNGEAVICTEVGQNQMWAAQYYRFAKPRSFVTSGGLGTMGFGLPAAIGAQIAAPDRVVFDIAGDGSVQMTIQELATISNYSLPVKVAILNNSCLGMVRQWQELFFDKRYSETLLAGNPDFVKLADAYGIKGMLIRRPEDVPFAVREALDHDGPVVMDFRVKQEANVFPMVPAGGSINKMLAPKGVS